MGTDIHVKNRGLDKVDMLFGNDRFFGSVHAADGGAVIIAAVRVPRTYTLYEGNSFRDRSVGRPKEVSPVRACSAQQPFELDTRYDIGMDTVAEFRPEMGVKDLVAWSQDDGADFDLLLRQTLPVIHCLGQADPFAEPATDALFSIDEKDLGTA